MPHDVLSLDHGGEANPITIEVTRNGIVECRHRGSAVIVDVGGAVQGHWGDIKQSVYPRSAIKALQAIPTVECGAVDAAGFDDPEIAVMGASHNGEERHTQTVASMLAKLGLGEGDLECGPQWPSREATTVALARSGSEPTQLHNNCSGKHAGMLALARHMGVPTKGYTKPTHPVQQRLLGAMENMCNFDLGGVAPGIDGCSAPNWPIPLENLAYGFARLADPKDLPEARARAADRFKKAVFKHPFLVAGTERFCSSVMEILGERAFIKTGAEGVFCAALPEYGLGVALKCDDGASRAAEVMMASLLRHIGVVEEADLPAMAPWLNPVLRNRADRIVGDVRAAKDWLAF